MAWHADSAGARVRARSADEPMTEMRLAPADAEQLDAIFSALCDCAALNPDPDASDGDEVRPCASTAEAPDAPIWCSSSLPEASCTASLTPAPPAPARGAPREQEEAQWFGDVGGGDAEPVLGEALPEDAAAAAARLEAMLRVDDEANAAKFADADDEE